MQKFFPFFSLSIEAFPYFFFRVKSILFNRYFFSEEVLSNVYIFLLFLVPYLVFVVFAGKYFTLHPHKNS